ncbi:glycine zipper 2TM domain-containing protein [Novosphingobium aquimarinum]|uniref:glycine zipper 2TM domain-containing protein n=1 Tax=Novosphingobium aquimarinum TaxID=2682494 RepID=UPI0012EC4B18|nr:glycine zipper 2TM domain-containing protein [Novosphingobium aquimarinum]
MNTIFKLSALAAASVSLASAVPASAAVQYGDASSVRAAPGTEIAYNQYRDYRGDYRDNYRRGYRDDYRRGNRRSYDEPVYRSTSVWRGRDGRYYCRKKNGTTGLIIGGAVGALLGRSIDGGRDRTLGTVLGAVGGALLGRQVDRGGSRCR